MTYRATAERAISDFSDETNSKKIENIFDSEKEAIMWLISIKTKWIGNDFSDFIMLKKLKDQGSIVHFNSDYIYGFQIFDMDRKKWWEE